MILQKFGKFTVKEVYYGICASRECYHIDSLDKKSKET